MALQDFLVLCDVIFMNLTSQMLRDMLMWTPLLPTEDLLYGLWHAFAIWVAMEHCANILGYCPCDCLAGVFIHVTWSCGDDVRSVACPLCLFPSHGTIGEKGRAKAACPSVSGLWLTATSHPYPEPGVARSKWWFRNVNTREASVLDLCVDIWYAYTHAYTFAHTQTHTHAYVYTHIYIYTYMDKYMYIYNHIHIHIYIHTYTHIHTYIHSYIHTYIPT